MDLVHAANRTISAGTCQLREVLWDLLSIIQLLFADEHQPVRVVIDFIHTTFPFSDVNLWCMCIMPGSCTVSGENVYQVNQRTCAKYVYTHHTTNETLSHIWNELMLNADPETLLRTMPVSQMLCIRTMLDVLPMYTIRTSYNLRRAWDRVKSCRILQHPSPLNADIMQRILCYAQYARLDLLVLATADAFETIENDNKLLVAYALIRETSMDTARAQRWAAVMVGHQWNQRDAEHVYSFIDEYFTTEQEGGCAALPALPLLCKCTAKWVGEQMVDLLRSRMITCAIGDDVISGVISFIDARNQVLATAIIACIQQPGAKSAHVDT